ncbi:hypothetical protein FRB99_005765 [Tulasnella sp. 403]|nr:hypothetical protein FRB99_005765 [Tulasnella sp. 403]
MPNVNHIPETPSSRSIAANTDRLGDPRLVYHTSGEPPKTTLTRDLVVVALVVAPLVFLPFIPLRRRLGGISKEVGEMKALQRETMLQSSLVQDRDAKMLRAIRSTIQKHQEGSGQRMDFMQKEIGALQASLGEERTRLEKEVSLVRADIVHLAERVETAATEKESGVKLPPRTLEEIAAAFVDIAAFVEEMETLEGLERRGKDPRGVERMRRLAMNLHALAGSVPSTDARKTGDQL